MTLQDAFDLFRRLGLSPEMISRPEFSAAYYGLARRYHPDVNPATPELMANRGHDRIRRKTRIRLAASASDRAILPRRD